jgi:thiol-disulfide isomerase/thioredoxin
LLLLDSVFPDRPARLLWLEGRTASRMTDGGAAVTDGAGGVLVFDGALRPRRPALASDRRDIVSVAGGAGGDLWLTDADGAVLLAGPEGTLREMAVDAFDYPVVAADPRHPGAWLVRRHQRWEYRLPAGTEPLLVAIDESGSVVGRAGAVVTPQVALLSELASAGHVAVSREGVYYAPFIRDVVIAFSPEGDTVWVASRDLPQSTPEPRFEVSGGRATIDYHAVNLGAVVGPDDRLYVLSTPGFTTSESRLDVFDRATGTLVRTGQLATALPTLAADRDGRVYGIDALKLLTGEAPEERVAFAPFELALLSGGVLGSAALAGRVTLINFWASWCEPCRTEMPALDSLRHEITDNRFQFLTMNEDVNEADAAGFVREFGFGFPVLLGRGRLKERYHYFGLPLTVVVDADGRMVQRWLGFTGPQQIQAIRAVVMAELRRMDGVRGSTFHEHH